MTEFDKCGGITFCDKIKRITRVNLATSDYVNGLERQFVLFINQDISLLHNLKVSLFGQTIIVIRVV